MSQLTAGMLLKVFFARLMLSLVINRLNSTVQMNVQVHTASGGSLFGYIKHS